MEKIWRLKIGVFLKDLFFVISLISFLAAAPTAWSSSPVTLKLGTYFSTMDVRYDQAQYFARQMAERTKGNIKIEIYPGEQLAKAKEAVTAVAGGAVDMYLPFGGHFGGTFPVYDLVCQGFIYPSFDVANKAIDEITVMLDKDFQKHGIKVPFAYVSGTLNFFSSNKFYKSADDLKGVKMAGIGGAVDKMLKSIGAGMISITSPERYLALQRKVVDATITTNATFWATKLYEVAPYATIVDSPLPVHFLIVNLNKWNSLPPDVQQIFINFSPDMQSYTKKTFMELDKKIYDDLAKVGGKIYFSTAEEKKIFRDELLKIVEEGLKTKGEVGQKSLAIVKKYSK
jgi:TRAP-type C4-dicarboxylate transport system substrate-binding protein